jgi:hypothetical protein
MSKCGTEERDGAHPRKKLEIAIAVSQPAPVRLSTSNRRVRRFEHLLRRLDVAFTAEDDGAERKGEDVEGFLREDSVDVARSCFILTVVLASESL